MIKTQQNVRDGKKIVPQLFCYPGTADVMAMKITVLKNELATSRILPQWFLLSHIFLIASI